MSKRIIFTFSLVVITALVAGFWISNDALAQDDRSQRIKRKINRGLGQVTETSVDHFTVQRRDGEIFVLRVDENTKFRTRDGEQVLFEDMVVGGWISVVVAGSELDEPLAKVVVYLPQDFDPEKISGAAGRIVEVDQTGSTFTVNNREEVEKVFLVDEETTFKGRVESLSELQQGMQAKVGAVLLEDESLLANIVQAGFPTVKIIGKISSVEFSQETFVLETRRGKRELIISVDEKTRFRSKDDIVEKIDDLQTGMIAVIVAEKPKEKLDWKMPGEIVSIDGDTFTIENRNGKQYTLLVTEDTHFRSPAGVVQGIDDLEVGKHIIVGFDDLGSGVYRAGLVIAGRKK